MDGKGPVLVLPAWWVSHVERDFEDPAFRGFFTRLAESLTVVRYDRAGVGLSDRTREALTLEDELATLEALVDEVGADEIALFGGSCGGPPAIAYAAKHPSRVTHLVLFGAYAQGSGLVTRAVREAMLGLVRTSWGLGAKALFDLFHPDHTGEERHRFSSLQRDWATPEMAARLLELTYDMDVSPLLSKVSAPTLVLHRTGDRAIPFEHGRELASRIRGAELASLPGNAHLPWLGDWAAVARAVLAFIAPPRAERTDENAFVREGDVWRVAFGGRVCHLRHARGLGDLARLLAQPGTEFSAAALMAGVEVERPSMQPVLDDSARDALRERIDALDQQIRLAEAAGSDAALAATEERDRLIRELASATGLGGRPRAFAEATERARKAVTARIRDSIEKIRAELPELGAHLDGAIATGVTCVYRPEGDVAWRT